MRVVVGVRVVGESYGVCEVGGSDRGWWVSEGGR